MTEEEFVKLDEINLVVEDEYTVRLHKRYLAFHLRKFVGKKNTRFNRWRIGKSIAKLNNKFMNTKTTVLATKR